MQNEQASSSLDPTTFQRFMFIGILAQQSVSVIREIRQDIVDSTRRFRRGLNRTWRGKLNQVCCECGGAAQSDVTGKLNLVCCEGAQSDAAGKAQSSAL